MRSDCQCRSAKYRGADVGSLHPRGCSPLNNIVDKRLNFSAIQGIGGKEHRVACVPGHPIVQSSWSTFGIHLFASTMIAHPYEVGNGGVNASWCPAT